MKPLLLGLLQRANGLLLRPYRTNIRYSFFALFAVATATFPIHQALAACITSGTQAKINAALVHPGNIASLCPNSVFTLNASVQFTAPNQEISTQGYPTDGTRAILRVAGASLATAINGNGLSGIKIRYLAVDGSRPALGRLASGGALIQIGGYSSGQIVEQVHAYEPRGWSTLHISEGNVAANKNCSGAQILSNQIGPAGEPDSQWADGISFGCTNSLVENNIVTDATDGGIVVFGAPGSLIQGNTIQELTRVLLGGINMVDYAPYSGNFRGTRVIGNTINSGTGSGYIKVGIGMGSNVWSQLPSGDSGVNVGGTVTNNTFEGNGFGYATAENGVVNFNVAGNVLSGGPIFDGLTNNCASSNAWPTAFSVGTVTDGVCLIPQFNFRLGAFVAHTNQPINMGELMYAVMQADGNFVLYGAPGQALWATGTSGIDCSKLQCEAVFQTDGNFVLYRNSVPFWSTGTHAKGAIQIRFAPVSPWLQITSGTGVLWKAD